jgi:hypothetical protein
LLYAGCDYHKQRNLNKVSWQPDRRVKKLPLSATHQTVNFEPLNEPGVSYKNYLGEKLFSQKLKQNNWHVSYQNKDKAISAITFIKRQQ